MEDKKKQLKKEIADLKNKIKDLKAEIEFLRHYAQTFEKKYRHYEMLAEGFRKELSALKWSKEKNFGINNSEKDGPKL
jgi:chromosome segregation ATPase